MHRINMSKAVRLGWFNIYDPDADYRIIFKQRGLIMLGETDDDQHMDFLLVDTYNLNKKNRPKIVMELLLSKSKNKNSWHVDYTRVDNLYQGQGLAPKMYRKLLKKMPGLMLEAGNLQSAGGRGIWAELGRMNDIWVFGKTKRSQPFELDVDECENELMSFDRRVYDNPRSNMYVFATAC